MSEFLKDLNPAQREAVIHTIGPLLRLDPNYQPAHKLLDDIKQTYYKQGLVLVHRTHTEAINAFQKAIEIDPDF